MTTPKETLSQKQRRFTLMIGKLIAFAYETDRELTFGDAFRSPEEAARLAKLGLGVKNSIHTKRLAVDFNLFINNIYVTSTEDYRKLGEFWESIGGTWGGRFGDGNHFSLEHGGVK